MHAINYSKNFVAVGLLALLVFLGGPYLLHHIPAHKFNVVANALLADVLITFPLACYYFVIRPLRLKKRNLLFVITLCCGLGYIIMPSTQRHYIMELRKLSVIVELGVVIYALTKVKNISNEYKRMQSNLPDTAFNLQQSIIKVLGNTVAIRLLASEITILRFGLLFWCKTIPVPKSAQSFTIHKNSGYVGLFGIIIFVAIIEVVAVHLVVAQYNNVWAAVISIFSLYGIMFLLADISAVLKSPVLIINNQLLLRAGIRWRLLTPLSSVESITAIKNSDEFKISSFNGALLKDDANVLISFKQPVMVNRIYRQPIETNQIVLNIDDLKAFTNALAIDGV